MCQPTARGSDSTLRLLQAAPWRAHRKDFASFTATEVSSGLGRARAKRPVLIRGLGSLQWPSGPGHARFAERPALFCRVSPSNGATLIGGGGAGTPWNG